MDLSPVFCRCADRYADPPGHRFHNVGFRLVLAPVPSQQAEPRKFSGAAVAERPEARDEPEGAKPGTRSEVS